jgi:UDPglucose 6-dehydrogenase
MRVAYFNELDSYAYTHNLNTKEIIEGMSYDPRIGDHYNNPSFGYGGYCLPKDTKQLKANFENIPQAIVSAIIKSNELRKEFITKSIIDKKPKTVGVYRLIMKSGSDNFRESSTIEILKSLKEKGIDIVIHEPSVKEDYFMNFENIKSLERFKQKSDLIIANRISTEISDVSSKIFSRDVFGKD